MRLRVELDAGDIEVTVLEPPLDSAVVHVPVRDRAALGQGLFVHREPVVLRGDGDAPVPVADRLVRPPGVRTSSCRSRAERKSGHLDAHADADDRHLAGEVADAPDGVRRPPRVAGGAVADEECVGFCRHHLVRCCGVREDVNIGAPAAEALKNVPLHPPEIDDGDPLSGTGDPVRLGGAGDAPDEVDVTDRGGAARARLTASSPSSLPTMSDALSVPTVRVFIVRLRVSTPDIPRRPFSSKYSATEGRAAGTRAISRATQPAGEPSNSQNSAGLHHNSR